MLKILFDYIPVSAIIFAIIIFLLLPFEEKPVPKQALTVLDMGSGTALQNR